MLNRFSGIRGKLKEDIRLEGQKYPKQQADIAEECVGTEINYQSLKSLEKFCYLEDISFPLNDIKKDGMT